MKTIARITRTGVAAGAAALLCLTLAPVASSQAAPGRCGPNGYRNPAGHCVQRIAATTLPAGPVGPSRPTTATKGAAAPSATSRGAVPITAKTTVAKPAGRSTGSFTTLAAPEPR